MINNVMHNEYYCPITTGLFADDVNHKKTTTITTKIAPMLIWLSVTMATVGASKHLCQPSGLD